MKTNQAIKVILMEKMKRMTLWFGGCQTAWRIWLLFDLSPRVTMRKEPDLLVHHFDSIMCCALQFVRTS